jgi:hypothetical protein
MDQATTDVFLDRMFAVMRQRLEVVVSKGTLQRFTSKYSYVALAECSRTHLFLLMYTIARLLEITHKRSVNISGGIRSFFSTWYYSRSVPSLVIATAASHVPCNRVKGANLTVVPLLPDSSATWHLFWHRYLTGIFQTVPLMASKVVVVAYNNVVYEVVAQRRCGCNLTPRNSRHGLFTADKAFNVAVSDECLNLEQSGATFMGMCADCINTGLHELADAFVLSDAASTNLVLKAYTN